MIHVHDLERVMLGGPAGIALGSGGYRDEATGRNVIDLGNGTFLDPSTGNILDYSGNVVQSSRPAPSSGDSSVLHDISQIISGIGSTVGSVATAAAPLFGRPPVQPVETGPSLGEIAAGVVVVGGIGYGISRLLAKPARRRRRRG